MQSRTIFPFVGRHHVSWSPHGARSSVSHAPNSLTRPSSPVVYTLAWGKGSPDKGTLQKRSLTSGTPWPAISYDNVSTLIWSTSTTPNISQSIRHGSTVLTTKPQTPSPSSRSPCPSMPAYRASYHTVYLPLPHLHRYPFSNPPSLPQALPPGPHRSHT